ncbi:MAG TPA: AarF/ABC1/UbiB kinase family protein [Acidimicrobiales bacterium]|jgi:predicted unusual protein kinase regulating ubiquinone biosynthesis (AarF/ABC1/UbiB family)|nr:AarF/ABC1/UbiB kinase family protein [Acidimicrobiales bacterium]
MRKGALGALGALLAGGGAAAALLRDEDRRHRLDRQARVWRLTARRGVHYLRLRVKGRAATAEERARLEQQFAIRTAEDVAEVLGGMKGAIMKAGQMLSFIADGLPPEAQAALATLQADVPPMAPSLAEGVVRSELGADPERLFLDWDPVPVAAASIGQVHKAVMPDGRIVAVKVQYPGVDKAIKSDLDNAELLYGLFAQFALKNLDVKALVDELRARMADELDYRLEARFQSEFAERYDGHPFIHVPKVVPERSARRVLTTEWVEGRRWDDFLSTADAAAKNRAAEVIFRFAQGSIHRHGVFNGDPHPGNYRFHDDGSVTFLDFGLVKRWSPGEFDRLTPVLDAILESDAAGAVGAAVDAGFLAPDHGFEDDFVFSYIRGPYEPFLADQFTYTRAWTAKALQTVVDLQGRYGDLIKRLNMPTSYVILDRVVWGVSALLGRLHATNNWRGILQEYRKGAPPVTELGRIDAEWAAARAQSPSA